MHYISQYKQNFDFDILYLNIYTSNYKPLLLLSSIHAQSFKSLPLVVGQILGWSQTASSCFKTSSSSLGSMVIYEFHVIF